MLKSTSCEACVYYEGHVANRGQVKEDAGLCRYNPPIMQPEPNARGLWPVVSAHDWCGHFQEARAAQPRAA